MFKKCIQIIQPVSIWVSKVGHTLAGLELKKKSISQEISNNIIEFGKVGHLQN